MTHLKWILVLMKTATILILFLATPLVAQDTRGQIVGRVQDSSQAVIPGAEVRVTNIGTNVTSTARTNQTGDFLLTYLVPGTYTLTVTLEGFREFVREGIPIRIGDRVTIDVTLQPGSVTERVVVEATAPLLEQASASMGQVIDTRRISELPLREGNPMLLANTVPGVLNFAGSSSTDPSSVNGSSAFATSGTRSSNNDITLDGVANTARSTVAYVPPVDVVEEFRIQTASFDASQGFTPGSVVNVTLKSGTNQLHGSAYEFLQNDVLNANRFFSNMSGQEKPPLRFNRWGINGTGPFTSLDCTTAEIAPFGCSVTKTHAAASSAARIRTRCPPPPKGQGTSPRCFRSVRSTRSTIR